MKTLASRIAALEKKQKTVKQRDNDHREERFIKDGQPWVRYLNRLSPYFDFELACNGQDDPLDEIWRRAESGEAKPVDLTDDESSCWDTAVMSHLGDQIIKRIHAGEIMPEDLTPNERDCWELVEAVREKY